MYLNVFDDLMDQVSQIDQLSRCIIPRFQWTSTVVLSYWDQIDVYLDILSFSISRVFY